MMRRLPVYLLIDTSGSMRGEPIESVKAGVQSLISGLRQDPSALECVYVSIISFDREAKVLCPLTSLEDFQTPEFECPRSGPTHLGAALARLCNQFDEEVIAGSDDRKGDWRPLLFIMTDGAPSDTLMYETWVEAVRSKGFGTIVACAAGTKGRQEPLRAVADHVVTLDTMDSIAFSQFFRFVSQAVSSGAQSMGTAELVLPPPPEEVHVLV